VRLFQATLARLAGGTCRFRYEGPCFSVPPDGNVHKCTSTRAALICPFRTTSANWISPKPPVIKNHLSAFGLYRYGGTKWSQVRESLGNLNLLDDLLPRYPPDVPRLYPAQHHDRQP
jgi:hypothetical protein